MRRPNSRNFRVGVDEDPDDGLPASVPTQLPRVITVEDQEADAYRMYVSARLHDKEVGLAVHVLATQSALAPKRLSELVRDWKQKRRDIATHADEEWARLELLNQYEESRMRVQMCYTLFPQALFVEDKLKTLKEARLEGQWQAELVKAIKDLKKDSDNEAEDQGETKKVSEHVETLNRMVMERTTNSNGDVTEKVEAMRRSTFGST